MTDFAFFGFITFSACFGFAVGILFAIAFAIAFEIFNDRERKCG